MREAMRFTASIVLAGVILKVLDVTYHTLLVSDLDWAIGLLFLVSVGACVWGMQDKSSANSN
jgi:hypothetical protein